MQSKLDKFFKVTPNKSSTSKKCFIYNPLSRSAFFTTSSNISDNDTFICSKSGLKLYYRKFSTPPNSYDIPNIQNTFNFPPLLKSNLQKAVRRKNTDSAILSTLILLDKDTTALLRRLPIIYIEDVCLLDTFPIIVWFMIADKDYKLTSYDIDIILNIVWNLCNIDQYYDDTIIKCNRELTHELVETFDHHDCLLAIYYRMLYGGMKGDMTMLSNSIEFYNKEPNKIIKNTFGNIDYERISNLKFQIIPESIDFHVYPYMLDKIRTQIISETDYNITSDEIKYLIWFNESGINIRKPSTIESFNYYSKKPEWNCVKKYLDNFRNTIIYFSK